MLRSFIESRACHVRLLNVVIDFPEFAPVVGEVQIHYRPILELKVCGKRGARAHTKAGARAQ